MLTDGIDYAALPVATRNQDGFGYFSSTPGTIKCSVASLRFGAPVQREIEPPNPDPRDIRNGSVIYESGYADQPYLVKNKDGSLTCVLTVSDVGEGAGTQHVASTLSTDGGRTWSKPVPVEPPGSPESSWAVPIATPSGRIYVAYTYNATNMRTVRTENGEPSYRVDSLGKYVYRFSDDQGKSWSPERYEIPIRLTDYDRTNVYGGDVNGDGKVDAEDPKFFWGPSRAEIANGSVYLGIAKIRNFRPIITFAETEGFIFRSCNLLTELDPGKITWEMVPEGVYGLRSRGGIVCEETTPVVLSDGTLVALCRTEEGVIMAFYSSNQGNSWSSPEPLVYAHDGRPLKNPRAKPAIWRIATGKYLLWFENNGNTGFENRNPAWLALGEERDGRLFFSQPEVLLYSRDEKVRISYPDFVETNGQYLVTETQKSAARIHVIAPELINGLIGQAKVARVAQAGLSITWNAKLSRNLRLPAVPNLATNGMTVELWVKFRDLLEGQELVASNSDQPTGFQIRTASGRSLLFSMHFGKEIFEARADSNSLKSGWNHIVCIVDPGPRLIMWVINGRLSDGLSERATGWTRYPLRAGQMGDTPTVFVAAKVHGSIERLRYYDRALSVSEAIGNYRAGNAK